MVLYVTPHAVLSAVAHVAHCIFLLVLLTILESRPVPVTGISRLVPVIGIKVKSRQGVKIQSGRLVININWPIN